MDKKRIASWWMGWEDLNWPNGDNLDRIKRRADAMAQANVTSAMIFGAHFRWDYLPFFTLLHDYLGTVAEQLHQRGVELYDHHAVNLIHRYPDGDRAAMRHAMELSKVHLPLFPSREAAATWEYKGKRLNDWRMIDVKTGKPLWYPQYAGEGFCHRNPDFIQSYKDYVKRLIADTGIDGLSADDPVHYMRYNSCACPHCRAELKRRTGIELPPIEDQSFWGNWANPAWHAWIDMRFEATGEFFEQLAQVIPQGFELMSCGASSATGAVMGNASDARNFLRGCTRANLEMSGNTPAYKHDPVTVNTTMSHRLINASHHQAVAREKKTRCFGTGFGFTPTTAGHVWAVNKALDADCWFSTLKARLGLADHILDTLPEEPELVKEPFTFEKEHPELFGGEHIGQLAVYFSYETRNHTFLGALNKGYYQDYRTTLECLFKAGLSPHTVFDFPAGPDQYPLVLLPSAASMTEQERAALKAYLAAGGRVVVTGPSALEECVNHWQLPTRPDVTPVDFFSRVEDGVWHRPAQWEAGEIGPCPDPDGWCEPVPGLYYNPCRMSEGTVAEGVRELCEQYAAPMPVRVQAADGYLVTMFRQDKNIVVHLLAEDYDTDIDHHLDEIRFHRSRVNLITKVTPIHTADVLSLSAPVVPKVYTPIDADCAAGIRSGAGECTVSLSKPCSYVILYFEL
ncbi:MAG: hypothetical protein IJP02_07040 [Oscillospiraceae bacterium]|nr:hypothetical protein [Oscillospiraceae bacterium]